MIKIVVLKMVRGTNFNASIVQRISPNVVLEFNKGSKVTLGRRVRIHSGSKIKVRPCANLIIENNVKMNYNCIIVCHEKLLLERERSLVLLYICMIMITIIKWG